MSETGAIKFTCEHLNGELLPFAGFAELNTCRGRLHALRLIGVGADGIGYGNLSVRDGVTNNFYITGSGTGVLPELGLEHYAKVTAHDFTRNWLRCEGRALASSESLTHSAIYETDQETAAVIHCHSAVLWSRLRANFPTTDAHVEYGTPQMADEVRRLFRDTNAARQKLFVMGGHKEGVVVFGKNLNDALAVLLRRRRDG